jgi:hypothetical protein
MGNHNVVAHIYIKQMFFFNYLFYPINRCEITLT